jgi:glutamate racemase
MESYIQAVVSGGLHQQSASVLANADMTQAPIGIFDSGVGGITVLREIYQQLPSESVVYVADTANLPYGDRSPGEILEFVFNILTWMEKQKVKMVIMACNTSSALALETVQAEFPFPILGLILPGAKAAVKKGKRIGVIATQATVNSHAYSRAMQEIDPSSQVWEISCPKFVPLIENNRIDQPITRKVAQRYLAPLLEQEIDTLVYGCTHYPHLAPVLTSLLPGTVNLVDPAVHVVAAAYQELELLGLRNNHHPLPTRFCVSGSSQQFAQVASQWLGYTPPVETVAIHHSVPKLQVMNQIQLKAV